MKQETQLEELFEWLRDLTWGFEEPCETGRDTIDVLIVRDKIKSMLATKNVIEKELTETEINRGIKRKYVPAKMVIEKLEALKYDPSKWKVARAGGQDGYSGMPPAIREIDEIINLLER